MRVEREMMRGSGPLAVLQLLSRRELYGYEMVEALERQTEGVLAMGQSTLYPLLYNLEAKGWVSSREAEGPEGRTRRYYAITRAAERSWCASEPNGAPWLKPCARLGVLEHRAAGR